MEEYRIFLNHPKLWLFIIIFIKTNLWNFKYASLILFTVPEGIVSVGNYSWISSNALIFPIFLQSPLVVLICSHLQCTSLPYPDPSVLHGTYFSSSSVQRGLHKSECQSPSKKRTQGFKESCRHFLVKILSWCCDFYFHLMMRQMSWSVC